jgi:hypothetical protein
VSDIELVPFKEIARQKKLLAVLCSCGHARGWHIGGDGVYQCMHKVGETDVSGVTWSEYCLCERFRFRTLREHFKFLPGVLLGRARHVLRWLDKIVFPP